MTDGNKEIPACCKSFVRTAIVNYRTSAMVIDCLASLAGERGGSFDMDVVVIDNASGDASIDELNHAVASNGWSDWVRIAALTDNRGFAAGNNIVLSDRTPPKPDFLWLLNPDTYLRRGALSGLLGVMRQHPQAGLVGSCLEWPDGKQQHSMFRFHTLTTEFFSSLPLGPLTPLFERFSAAPHPRRETARFDWLSGASLLIRADVVDQIGLMDESFFLYFEETDFCLRARMRGWECWLAGDSRVVHLVGQCTGVTDRNRGEIRRPSYWFEFTPPIFRKTPRPPVRGSRRSCPRSQYSRQPNV